jgi:hypothetical protein
MSQGKAGRAGTFSRTRFWPRLLAMVLLCCVASPLAALEVQSHGLQFEKWLRDTFFEGYEPKGYTQKWDIPAAVNKHHGRIPVNPKATKYGTPIGLGDALRQFAIQEPFLMIVGFWQQVTPLEKRWVNVQAVRVEPAVWRRLWGELKLADLEALNAVIKDKSLTVEEARKRAQQMKAAACFQSAVIQLNPKIDHSQRRLQCSLRFDAFFDHLAPNADRQGQKAPQVFGVALPKKFESAPRVLTPER